MSIWVDMHKISTGEVIIKEDDISFKLVDEKGLLSSFETVCMKKSTLLKFKLGKYVSICHLLEDLNIPVIIVPGIEKRSAPLQLWENKVYLERKGDDKHAAWVAAQIRLWEEMPLRGLYDSAEKVIKLFPQEMRTEYNGEKMEQLLVSTLAHEAMHAYFDRPGHEHLPYVVSVEEPMAEFGMLLYLYENQEESVIKGFYDDWAVADVTSKKTCYRYGYALMQQHLKEAGIADGKPYARKTSTLIELESYKIPLI